MLYSCLLVLNCTIDSYLFIQHTPTNNLGLVSPYVDFVVHAHNTVFSG